MPPKPRSRATSAYQAGLSKFYAQHSAQFKAEDPKHPMIAASRAYKAVYQAKPKSGRGVSWG